MKNKTSRSSRQVMEINLYRVLIVELIKICTAAGIKLPGHVMQVVSVCFPMADKINPAGLIKENRCGYCSNSKKCITGLHRFAENGCGDKFKKKKWLFWKRVK
jgi:hypothetical protein